MDYFDLHCDTITECYNQSLSLWNNNLQLCVTKGKEINQWVQVYAIWMNDEFSDEAAYDYFNKVYEYFKDELKNHQKEMILVCSNKDRELAFKEKKRVAYLAIEGSRALGDKIERVQEFYDKGVRLMTLTWNGKTGIGDGCMLENPGGLTLFGKQVVGKMNEVGMIVDVSHLAEKGFWDVVSLSERPFVATHSNSKAVCNHPRNLTDKQFKTMIERKCLVGMNYYPLFINGTLEADIEELYYHIDHFIDLGGEDIIAMGSDFDGAKMPKHISGIQDISYLYKLLVSRYGQERADKFFFTNACRFFEDNF